MKSNIITRKKHQEFIEALQDPELWSPNFTKLSRRLSVSVSTIYEWFKKLNNKNMVACSIKIDVFNEPKVMKEQYEKWKVKSGTNIRLLKDDMPEVTANVPEM